MIEIKCDYCLKMFKTYACYNKRNRKNRFCSKKCEGEFNSLNNTVENWKGGYVSKSTGYKYISLNGKQIEEHRLVMMKHLGKKLNRDEFVNNINNLVVKTNSEHSHYHAKKVRTSFCAKCNKFSKIKARELCFNCYHYELVKGNIKKYPFLKDLIHGIEVLET